MLPRDYLCFIGTSWVYMIIIFLSKLHHHVTVDISLVYIHGATVIKKVEIGQAR